MAIKIQKILLCKKYDTVNYKPKAPVRISIIIQDLLYSYPQRSSVAFPFIRNRIDDTFIY